MGELRHVLERRADETLEAVIDRLRPTDETVDVNATLSETVAELRNDAALAARFREQIRAQIGRARFVHTLVDSGILPDKGVSAQLRSKLGQAIMPLVHADRDLRSLLAHLFSKGDWSWVQDLDTGLLAELVDVVVEDDDVNGLPHEDVGAALRALAQRIGATGIDDEINAKLPEVEDYDSPFLDLSVVTHRFLEDHRGGPGSVETFEAVRAKARECRAIVCEIRDNKRRYGTSLHLTRVTRRLLQQLRRFELLIDLVHPLTTRELSRSISPLVKELITAQQTSTSFRRVISDNLDLVAFQITEHTAKKGERFVSSSPREYRNWLVAAMGGGAIVAVFAVFKLLLAKLDVALAGQAILYGLNYSLCFVLIYLTGSILATKQPAVTASAIARRLDEAKTERGALEGVAETIVLVWRSQFVSFLGNLLCAIPIAIAVSYGLAHLFGVHAADANKAQALLEANHPLQSGALFFAAIAGVFLFLSGVIQGAVANRVVHTGMRQRLAHHPKLAFLGTQREALADFTTRHLSGLIANSALGFMLGSAGVIGIILGLPFDIRHIAFSAAHFGVAVFEGPGLINVAVALPVFLGVLAIGFVNFVVSFGLTLAVTLKSRRVSFGQHWKLVAILARMFVAAPLRWFLPLPLSTPSQQPA